MKKLTAIILCALLLVAMAIPAFAATEAKADGYVDNPAFEVKKATTAWKADGVMSDGEYYKIDVQKTWISGAWADESMEDACLNLDFTLAMSWDESYIYTFITFVDPDGHSNTCDADPGSMWQQGAVQLNFADVDCSGDQRLEYGIGKSSDTGDLISTVWADYLSSGYAVTGDFGVTVDGSTVTYEARTPYSAFTETAAATGVQYGVCYVIAWGADTSHLHTQLATGCTGFGKDAGAFAHITLADAPVVYTYPGSGITPASGSLLFAGVIGNETGWGDNAAAGAAAAFDGNPTTFFDPLGVGDGFCGVDAGDTYVLTEVHILPRDGQLPRYEGATIRGSNDGENWTDLYVSPAAADAQTWQVITEFENNTGYRYYSYFNTTNHGDVADVEFYGVTPSGEAAPEVTVPDTAPVTTPAAQTADFIAVAALVSVISLAGVALSKKR